MEIEKGYWNWQFIELLGLEIPNICSSTCPAEHVEQRISQTLVFQIKFCGKSPALRVAAKRSQC
jgi:hypothetical protein